MPRALIVAIVGGQWDTFPCTVPEHLVTMAMIRVMHPGTGKWGRAIKVNEDPLVYVPVAARKEPEANEAPLGEKDLTGWAPSAVPDTLEEWFKK